MYEYFDQGAWPGPPRLFPDLIGKSVSSLHELGTRYYATQASTGFAVNGFNLFFLSRALWNPDVDVDETLALYCEKGFGGASEAMKAYFNLWRDRWKELKGLTSFGDSVPGTASGVARPVAPFDQIRRLYPKAFLKKCQTQIDLCAEGDGV